MNEGNGRPAGWAETTLRDILPIHYGKGLTEKNRDENGTHPVYGSSGAVGVHSEALTSTETLIIGRKGSVGSVHYSSVPCWPIDTVYYAEANEDRELKFFYYLLTHLRLGQLDKSTTIPGLSRDDYNPLSVNVPPLFEQRRIVAAIEEQFSRLDAGVAALERVRANLKRYRTAVLKAAVEGRLTEAWRRENPDVEPASKLLERVLRERRELWEREQIASYVAKGKKPPKNWQSKYKETAEPVLDDPPLLPQGWSWSSLARCSHRITDGTHQPPQFTDEGVPFVFVRHIVGGSITFENTKFISERTYRELNSRCPVEVGDVLYSAVGSYGVAVPVKTDDKFSFQRHIAHIKPAASLVQDYLVTALNSPVCMAQAHKVARGVAQKTVTLGDLSRFAIPIPPIEEQEHIAREVARRVSVIEVVEATLQADLRRAERLRQSILKRAFEGKLVP